MLNKYDFTNKDDVIDQPSILKITSDLVLIIHASGTDTEEIPEEGLVILIGNIDSFIPPTSDPINPDNPEIIDPNNPGQTPIEVEPGSESGSGSGENTVNITLVNNCGVDVRLCGEVMVAVSTNPNNWSNIKTINVDFINPHSHGWAQETNDRIIKNNESTTWTATIKDEDSGYLNGSYSVMGCDSPAGWVGPVYLYCKYYKTSDGSVEQGNGIYHTTVTSAQPFVKGATITATVNRLKLSNGTSGTTDAMVADNNTTPSNIPNGIRYAVLLPGKLTL